VKLNASVKYITETAIEMPSPTVGPLLSTLLGATTPFQVPMGFISLFGAGNSVFVPGTGYGVRWALDDSYAVAAEKGLGFPALPGLITPGLVTTSSTGISYGLFALPDPKVPSFAKAQVNAETGANRYTETYGVEVGDDAMLIPFLASAFTAVFYGQAPAKLEPDESFGITNYFIIGDGDVASVMNTVYELRGLATEELAGEVRDAFDLLAINDVQVILSDQRMSDMSGTEFLGRVKMLYPDTIRHVLSGYTDLNTVTDAINRGAIYRFLTKPWNDDELRKHIHQAFRTYEEQRRSNAGPVAMDAGDGGEDRPPLR
jgi:ActR/RegA family two-component response regulator